MSFLSRAGSLLKSGGRGLGKMLWDRDMPVWYNAGNLALNATLFIPGVNLITGGIRAATMLGGRAVMSRVAPHLIKTPLTRAASSRAAASARQAYRSGGRDANTMRARVEASITRPGSRLTGEEVTGIADRATRRQLEGGLGWKAGQAALKHPFLTASAAVGVDGYANGFGVSKWGIEAATGIDLGGDEQPTVDPETGAPTTAPEDEGMLARIFNGESGPIDSLVIAVDKLGGDLINTAGAKAIVYGLAAILGLTAANQFPGMTGLTMKLSVLGGIAAMASGSDLDTGAWRTVKDLTRSVSDGISNRLAEPGMP